MAFRLVEPRRQAELVEMCYVKCYKIASRPATIVTAMGSRLTTVAINTCRFRSVTRVHRGCR
jgi:hypothetical protein